MRDVDVWAFSGSGPWQIELERLTWRRDIGVLRERTRRAVPDLARPRTVPPLARFSEATLFIGGALLGWMMRERRQGGSTSRAGLSRRLRRAFERLGPSYIKLGQIISSGRGIFPEELVEEFKACRDKVPPESFETVRRVVEEDLGRPLDAVFSRFDETRSEERRVGHGCSTRDGTVAQ